MSHNFHNSLTLFISLGFLAVSMILIYLAIKNAFEHNRQIERRLAGGAGVDLADLGIQKKSSLLETFGNHLSLPNAEEISRIRFELARAGYYDENTVKTFYAIRVITLVGPQLLILILWGFLVAKMGIKLTMLLTAASAIIGLLAPTWVLRWKQKRRTLRCREGFPDMMDLMVACIEAGLGLDAALIRVSHELGGRYPPLKVNLEIMNLELRAGSDRHEAMMGFANRINLDEAKALAIMLKQAEEMGSSIGKALRTFSDDMRAKRMLRAEEKAMALSAKLTVPLILFIFPTLMIMLLLPAGLRIAEGFQ